MRSVRARRPELSGGLEVALGGGGYSLKTGAGGNGYILPAPPPIGGSITQNGVTFNFDKSYPVGQFINGDWWVTPVPGGTTVTIVSVSPQMAGAPGATLRNGWVANPSGNVHGYDGRAAGYTTGPTNPALPYIVSPGTSIVKTVSLAGSSGTGANLTYLDNVVVLTVLATAPAADAFRPPYYGTFKPIFRQSSLLTGSLPSLASVGSPPSLANVAARYSQPQLDHVFVTSPGGRPNPLQSFHAFTSTSTPHVYGENIAIDNCEAILRTFLNDSIPSKLAAITNLVQAGIDWYAVAKNSGVAFAGGGGHQGGRKALVAYAGWLLNDSDMRAVAGETTGAGFGEKQQFYFSSAAGGVSSHFTGQPAGMALFGYVNTFSKPFPYSGSGAKDIRDNVGMIDGGLSISGGALPSETSATYHGGLYIDIASTHAILASTICGLGGATLRGIFNYDAEIFYADRLWDFGAWTQPDGTALGTPRPTGAPVTSLHGTLSGGAMIAASYGSGFGNAMRNAYYTSTFTG